MVFVAGDVTQRQAIHSPAPAAVVDLVAVHLQRLVEGAAEIAAGALRQPLDLEAEPVVALLLPEDDRELPVQRCQRSYE